MDCLFCSIAKQQIPAEIIYDDADTLAFLDIHPRALGHTLVIPKTHAENLLTLPTSLFQPFFLTVARVTDMLRKNLASAGFTIGINHGRVSGQEVDHLHVHILPRFAGDGGGSIQSILPASLQYSLAEIKEKILK